MSLYSLASLTPPPSQYMLKGGGQKVGLVIETNSSKFEGCVANCIG